MLDEPVGSLSAPSIAQGQDERAEASPPSPHAWPGHGLAAAWSGGSLPHRQRGNAVAGCGRRWSDRDLSGNSSRSTEQTHRDPLGRLHWHTGSLRWREHAQRSEEPQGRDAAGWAAPLRQRVAAAHAHAALLQRSPSDSWSGSPTCGRCRMGSRRGALPVLFRLPSPKLDVRLSTHPAFQHRRST